MLSLRPWGWRLSSFSEGGSVASARAANVSMIRLIQSIYTALRMASSNIMALIKVVTTATTFTVS